MTEPPPQAETREDRSHDHRTIVGRACDAAGDSVRFFTQIPAPGGWGAATNGRRNDGVAAAAPLAGALVGAAASGALVVALAIGLPPLAASVFAVAAAVALSGALHLDGLADLADGFGGGATREAKLAIMRDSRLGTFGGVALALALIARTALVAGLVDRLGAGGAALALIAAASLARPLAFVPILTLPPARADGLASAARPRRRWAAAGFALAAVAALTLVGPGAGLAAIALAVAAAAAVVALARRQIGGATGDVCGAAAELAEIAALVGLLAAANPA